MTLPVLFEPFVRGPAVIVEIDVRGVHSYKMRAARAQLRRTRPERRTDAYLACPYEVQWLQARDSRSLKALLFNFRDEPDLRPRDPVCVVNGFFEGIRHFPVRWQTADSGI